MAMQTATGKQYLASDGYIVYQHSNQSNPDSALVEVARYDAFDEAIRDAAGQGVDGATGEIDYYVIVIHEGHLVTEQKLRVFGTNGEMIGKMNQIKHDNMIDYAHSIAI